MLWGITDTVSRFDRTAPAAPRWPRLILFIAALIELAEGIGALPILAGTWMRWCWLVSG
jgi:hypothetical protein